MPQTATVFGAEVTIDRIKCDIVAIGSGWSVTAQVVLDQEDVLVAHTVVRREATFEEATGEMVKQAVAETNEWLAGHKF